MRHDDARGQGSWVRCICGTCGSHGGRVASALCVDPRAGGRQQSASRSGPVCLWCECPADPWSALPAQPGHTQLISGGDRRCQAQSGRTERSEPRSGGLDCRRSTELVVWARAIRLLDSGERCGAPSAKRARPATAEPHLVEKVSTSLLCSAALERRGSSRSSGERWIVGGDRLVRRRTGGGGAGLPRLVRWLTSCQPRGRGPGLSGCI